ncbi:kunitz trypsin inhibitor 2-like [Senna tora]|uniref:Kunitz trypsin inhibitor 2-like n=1 Tax=Senna tora TaxID=362788 RepID=A0A834SDI1_9FABA|nr:kunitz trypsin inhibitor 2-like [Senna tora]
MSSTLFFLLFAFITTTSLVVRAAEPEPVVDTSGKKLQAGASYYILPFLRGGGGGLTFGTVQNDDCPRVVVQEPFDTAKGDPVQFLPENPKNHVVFTSRNLNVKFTRAPSTPTPCDESRVWKLTKFINEAMHVGTDGVVGNKDFSAVTNWFKIEKAEDVSVKGVYKLRFCPRAGITCDDLGLFSWGDENKKYLGLTNPDMFHSFNVVFQKAEKGVMMSRDEIIWHAPLPFLLLRGGGGLTFGTVENDDCPRVVVQEPFDTMKGDPLQFLPENPKNHVVFTSRNLNIKFTRASTPTSCDESRVWKLTKFVSEAMHVGTNGVVGNKDFSAVTNWFKIEKAEDVSAKGVYKLRFCPRTGVTCEDVGLFSWGNENKKYLGLANPDRFRSFNVVFQKVDNGVMSS